MGVEVPSNPINRKEQYLAKIAGQAVEIPAEPLTREEAYLDEIAKNGSGGGGGTTNYNLLENKPQIAGTELQGNKSLADLGIASARSVTNITNGESINNFAGVESALSGKQDALTAGDYIEIDGNEISVNPVVPNENVTYEFKTKDASGGDATVTLIKKSGDTVISSTDYRYDSVMGNKYITVDDLFYFGYSTTFTTGSEWGYKLLAASADHAVDYTRTWGYDSTVDYTENFTSIDHSGESLVLKAQMDTALSTKQDTLTAGDYVVIENDKISVSKLKQGKLDLYSYEFVTTDASHTPKVKVIKKVNGETISETVYDEFQAANWMTFDNIIRFRYDAGDSYKWKYQCLVTSNEHVKDTVISWFWNQTVDYTETFDVGSSAITDLVTKGDMTDALETKADTDMVAADFNAGTSYTAGNYCIYEGKFYKFKASHSGAWSAADVDEIKIAGELSALKSGLAYSLYGAIDTSTVFSGTLFKESDIAFLKVEGFVSLATGATVLAEKIPVGYRPKVNVEFTLIQRNMSFRPLAFAVKTNGNIHIYNYGSEIDSRTAFGDTLSWPIGS